MADKDGCKSRKELLGQLEKELWNPFRTEKERQNPFRTAIENKVDEYSDNFVDGAKTSKNYKATVTKDHQDAVAYYCHLDQVRWQLAGVLFPIITGVLALIPSSSGKVILGVSLLCLICIWFWYIMYIRWGVGAHVREIFIERLEERNNFLPISFAFAHSASKGLQKHSKILDFFNLLVLAQLLFASFSTASIIMMAHGLLKMSPIITMVHGLLKMFLIGNIDLQTVLVLAELVLVGIVFISVLCLSRYIAKPIYQLIA